MAPHRRWQTFFKIARTRASGPAMRPAFRRYGYQLTATAKLPQHIQSNADQTTEKQVKPSRVTCFDSKKTPPPTIFLKS